MDALQNPKPTPVMVFKICGLTVTMSAGYGFIGYAGYYSMRHVLVPLILDEVACFPCCVLIYRYLKGKMFEADQLYRIRNSFYIGCLALVLAVISSVLFALMNLKVIKIFDNEEYGLYIGGSSSLLAVFWSIVLIYDAKYYWNLYDRVVGSTSRWCDCDALRQRFRNLKEAILNP